MDELTEFSAKMEVIQEIQNLQADLCISIDSSLKLARLKNSELVDMKNILETAHKTEFF